MSMPLHSRGWPYAVEDCHMRIYATRTIPLVISRSVIISNRCVANVKNRLICIAQSLLSALSGSSFLFFIILPSTTSTRIPRVGTELDTLARYSVMLGTGTHIFDIRIGLKLNLINLSSLDRRFGLWQNLLEAFKCCGILTPAVFWEINLDH